MEGWIGVDLDGTLAHYDYWRGQQHIGEPVPSMMQRVRAWLDEGRRVKIFTARVAETDETTRGVVVQTIQDWLHKHGLPALEVTNVKDYQMIELWDDRAVQVQPNTGIPIQELS